MKMTFRWFGDSDPVKLGYIRRIPGMYGSGRPGYVLYHRALGAAYLNGLWEAFNTCSDRGSASACCCASVPTLNAAIPAITQLAQPA